MTSPLCKYSKCGRAIVKHQYCIEKPGMYEERLQSGYCRRKCERLDKPSPSPKDRPSLVADPTAWNLERPELRAIEKETPVVDEAYRAWVRSLPCLVPGCYGQAQFHHQPRKGHGGKGTLCSDYRGTPLCYWHHTQGGTENAPGSYHGLGKITGWRFWKHYGIEPETVIHELNRAYLESGRKFKEG